jgi:hypothetical protein
MSPWMPQGVNQQALRIGCGWRGMLGAILIALAGSLLAPAAAHAGCGDHVVLTPRIDPLASTGPDRAPAPPAKPQRPCHGPNCKRGPITPAPAPVAPVMPDGQDWACIAAPLTLAAAISSPFLAEPIGHPPLLTPSGVYHPPR